MSEQTGILDETGQAISQVKRDAAEPLFRHMRERPVPTAFIILPLVSAFFIDLANAVAIGWLVR